MYAAWFTPSYSGESVLIQALEEPEIDGRDAKLNLRTGISKHSFKENAKGWQTLSNDGSY